MLNNQLVQTSRELKAFQSRTQKLTNEVLNFEYQIVELNDEVAELRGEIVELKREVESLKAQLESQSTLKSQIKDPIIEPPQ